MKGRRRSTVKELATWDSLNKTTLKKRNPEEDLVAGRPKKHPKTNQGKKLGMELASKPVGAPQVVSYINLEWLVNADLSQIQRGRKWKSADEPDLTPKPKRKCMGEQKATPGKSRNSNRMKSLSPW